MSECRGSPAGETGRGNTRGKQGLARGVPPAWRRRPLPVPAVTGGASATSCDEFTREMNRLRMEQRASLSSAKREVERMGTRIKKLLNLILDDEVAVEEGKVEIKALDARRKKLQAQLETAGESRPLLHPEMAELYRQKVTTLAQALERSEACTEATEADRRHRLDPRRGRAANRTQRESGCDAGGRPKCEEVARNGRPLAASCVGCGGGI